MFFVFIVLIDCIVGGESAAEKFTLIHLSQNQESNDWLRVTDVKNSFTASKKRNVRAALKGNTNKEFDSTLYFVSMLIQDREPFVTDSTQGIDYCNITGVCTLFRSGDITSQKINSTVNRVQMNLGWKQLKVSCLQQFKLFFYKVGHAKLEGIIGNMTVYIDALVNYDDDKSTFINIARITNPGTFQMQYKGEGFVGKTVAFFAKKIKPLLEKRMHRTILETVELIIYKSKEHMGHIGGNAEE